MNSLAVEVVKTEVSYPFYLGTEDVHSRFLSPTHIYKHTSDLIQLSALLPESFSCGPPAPFQFHHESPAQTRLDKCEPGQQPEQKR